MKKIIFVIESMNVGGTEKALLSMVSQIPKEKYDITILILEKRGEFLNHIPKHINIIFLEEYKEIKKNILKNPRTLLREEIKKNKYIEVVKTVFYQGISRITDNYNFYFNNKIMNRINNVKGEYDLAISYQGPPAHFSAYLVAKKINARKKVQWIHSDVSKLGLNTKTVSKLYKNFDKIFLVSNEARNKFIEIFPELIKKTEVFNNIVDSNLILKKSQEKKGFHDEFDGIRILTVGRLSEEKGQALTIPVLARLRREGYNVKWYCLGEGVLRQYYEKLIREYNIEEYYILLGNDVNPYPYFNECDLYVQSSRFEGYCLTLAEARIFNKPIVSTEFLGAREQIVHNETGLIVRYDEQDIYEGIKKMIDNADIREKFSNNLKLNNKSILENMNKLYNIIE